MVSEKAIIGKNCKIHYSAIVEDYAQIGDNTEVGPFCLIRENAKIGENCFFTAYCEIREYVEIGDNTSFGSRCTIAAHGIIGSNAIIKYGFVLTAVPDLERNEYLIEGSVQDGALIGANVMLMPGYVIGKNAIIGAYSQVRSNVGENEIWYGNPAKFYKMRE